MPGELRSFLEAYPPEVREWALGARALILRVVPDAEEKVLRPWEMIAYGLGKKFCAISPYRSWVNLHFHQGAALPDPSKLLEGTGKNARHVKVASASDLRRRALVALIKAAAREAE